MVNKGKRVKKLKTASQRSKLTASRIQNKDPLPTNSVSLRDGTAVELKSGSELFSFGRPKNVILDGSRRTRLSSASDVTVDLSPLKKTSRPKPPLNVKQKSPLKARKRKSEEKGEPLAKKTRHEIVEKAGGTSNAESTAEKNAPKESVEASTKKPQPVMSVAGAPVDRIGDSDGSQVKKNLKSKGSVLQSSAKTKSTLLNGSQNLNGSSSQRMLSQLSKGSAGSSQNGRNFPKKASRNRTSIHQYRKMDAAVPAAQRFDSVLKKVPNTKVNKIAKSYSMVSSYTPDSLPRVRNSMKDGADEIATPVTTKQKTVKSATKADTRTVNRSRFEFGNDSEVEMENQDPDNDAHLDAIDPPSAKDIEKLKNMTVKCLLDEDPTAYSTLVNHHPEETLNVLLSQKAGATFYAPTDRSEDLIQPGVHFSMLDIPHSSKLCTLRIEPKTCKPLELSVKPIVCTVISGSVSVKTAAFNFTSDGDPYLTRVALPPESHFYIPDGVMYSIENWTDEEAKLVLLLVS